MSRLTTLLATSDLSAPSRHAVTRAAMVARDSGARLHLLHVLPTGAFEALQHLLGTGASTLLEKLHDTAHQSLRQQADDIFASLGIPPGIRIARGPVLQQIAGEADALDADLVVLGARGAGYMHHLILGTTAERMLRKTLRSILVVKQLPHEHYQRVLVPVDFSSYSRLALEMARMVAPDAEIILLHVLDNSLEGTLRYAGVKDAIIRQYQMEARQTALDELRQLAHEANLSGASHHLFVIDGHPASCVLEQEEERDADLIVIGKHGKGSSSPC